MPSGAHSPRSRLGPYPTRRPALAGGAPCAVDIAGTLAGGVPGMFAGPAGAVDIAGALVGGGSGPAALGAPGTGGEASGGGSQRQVPGPPSMR